MRVLLLLGLAIEAFGQSAARGEKLFAQGCAVGYCHGAGGSSARAQRLRGRTFERSYLAKVIKDGIPNTAMPAWGDRLTEPDIEALVDYIQSLATASAEAPAPVAAESPAVPAVDQAAATPPELRRGRELFFDPHRAERCSVCHRLAGVGSQVGPDLTKVASLKTSDGPQAVRYTRARNVRTIVLRDGDRFPGIATERNGSRYYDLSVFPPVLRNLTVADIQTVQRQSNWRHRDAVKGYSPEDIQSIWSYVRWAATKY